MSTIGEHGEASQHTEFALDSLRVLIVCCLTSLGALGYFAVSARYDFAAHFLAGSGGSLITIAVFSSAAALFRVRQPLGTRAADRLILPATLTAIGTGIVIEYFVFGDPTGDLLDIVHQSLGAAFVGLIWTLVPAVSGRAGRVLVKALGLLILGLVMIVIGAKLVGLV